MFLCFREGEHSIDIHREYSSIQVCRQVDLFQLYIRAFTRRIHSLENTIELILLLEWACRRRRGKLSTHPVACWVHLCPPSGSTHTESGKLYRKVKHRALGLTRAL